MFRNTLRLTPLYGIFCEESCKALKRNGLCSSLSPICTISCGQNIDNKYFRKGGGGLERATKTGTPLTGPAVRCCVTGWPGLHNACHTMSEDGMPENCVKRCSGRSCSDRGCVPRLKKQIAGGLRRLERNVCRPYGTQSRLQVHPALPRWAKLFRPRRGSFSAASAYRRCPSDFRYSDSNIMALVSVILLFMTLPLMTQQAVAQQTLNPPQAVTDPTKLESKNVADMQAFSIEKLYMTRQIGSPPGRPTASRSHSSLTSAAEITFGWFLRPADGRRS